MVIAFVAFLVLYGLLALASTSDWGGPLLEFRPQEEFHDWFEIAAPQPEDGVK